MSYRVLTLQEHFEANGPKRILACDGGGLRGILSLGFLGRIESLLSERHGGSDDFRLAHYFDLIAGTSTGAIIAAALAKGMKVLEVVDHYMTIGRQVFKSHWFRKGVVRARYDEDKLIEQLKVVLGEDTRLGDSSIQTGVLIMTKRLDTGSPWPLGNNPKGKYFRAPEGATWISNGDYPLWQVVRASTAAPSFFDPQTITISEAPGREPVEGSFVDGGVSPFNNPSLQALMYATLEGFQVQWPTGVGALKLVSVGTGSADPSRAPARLAAAGALKALMSLMDDCASLVETLMQWMSSTRTARSIDRELGDLSNDLVAAEPLLAYDRYDLSLTRDEIDPLKPGLSDRAIASLSAMDEPDNLELLKELGELAAEALIRPEDFERQFDLKP